MDSNGLQWSPMDSNGIQWNPMDSNGLQWTPMDPNELQWTPIEYKFITQSLILISYGVYYIKKIKKYEHELSFVL
jgi:hypothetical protein